MANHIWLLDVIAGVLTVCESTTADGGEDKLSMLRGCHGCHGCHGVQGWWTKVNLRCVTRNWLMTYSKIREKISQFGNKSQVLDWTDG